MVATCARADGRDVNGWLVRQGWALDWPRYSRGAYAAAQPEARAAGRGVWAGAFVASWDWRRSELEPGASEGLPAVIKVPPNASSSPSPMGTPAEVSPRRRAQEIE